MKKFLLAIVLIVGCSTEPEETAAICVKKETTLIGNAPNWIQYHQHYCYDWTGSNESTCEGKPTDGVYYSNQTCSEYCEDNSGGYITCYIE